MDTIEQRIEGVVDAILADYRQERDIDRLDALHHPDKDTVTDIITKLCRIVFPGYSRDKNYQVYNARHNLSMLIEDVMYHLSRQIALVMGDAEEGTRLSLAFLQTIPAIRAVVQTDVQASFDGDPAATSKDEIIFSYPGLFAITVYRLAHELHKLNVPMIPRMMTEHAHGITGIDIHPGATVGKYFFIDHGTGIVIGANAFITHSIPECTTVTIKSQELQMKSRSCAGCAKAEQFWENK